MKNHKAGDRVVLKKEAGWTNYQCPTVTMPVGTALILESWRPEGWMARVEETGKFFFVFHRYIAE